MFVGRLERCFFEGVFARMAAWALGLLRRQWLIRQRRRGGLQGREKSGCTRRWTWEGQQEVRTIYAGPSTTSSQHPPHFQTGWHTESYMCAKHQQTHRTSSSNNPPTKNKEKFMSNAKIDVLSEKISTNTNVPPQPPPTPPPQKPSHHHNTCSPSLCSSTPQPWPGLPPAFYCLYAINRTYRLYIPHLNSINDKKTSNQRASKDIFPPSIVYRGLVVILCSPFEQYYDRINDISSKEVQCTWGSETCSMVFRWFRREGGGDS